MQFHIGQKVQALDEDIEGVIVAIIEQDLDVETDDGFIIRFRESALIPLKSMGTQNMDVPESVVKAKNNPEKKKSTRVKPKDRNLPPMEVDLHIHQLTKAKGLSNHEMLTMQIDTAKRQLEFAIRKRIPKVVFIHGVGKGVLRAELEYLFSRYAQVEYYDANYQKYGVGALEVYIFQNTK